MKLILLALAVAGLAGCGRRIIQGPQGLQGLPGLPGVGLVATTIPATLAQCPAGGSILITALDNAQTGVWNSQDSQQSSTLICNGVAGAVGLTGASGTNATPISIVQLCPGAPIYPSVFMETALCIDGKLEGVYSANGGFLTTLNDGSYNSNAIGSTCNLTVKGCIVSH
jgi:hypothetical protein